jgi:hypothetical protein
MRTKPTIAAHLEAWPWGPVLQVHEIGTYAIVEFTHANPDRGSEVSFHPFLQLERSGDEWHDTGHSYGSLDKALVAAIAWKYEDRADDPRQWRSTAANSQAAMYFMRMIGAAA